MFLTGKMLFLQLRNGLKLFGKVDVLYFAKKEGTSSVIIPRNVLNFLDFIAKELISWKKLLKISFLKSVVSGRQIAGTLD